MTIRSHDLPREPTWRVAALANIAALTEAFPFRWNGHVRHSVMRSDGALRAVAEVNWDEERE